MLLQGQGWQFGPVQPGNGATAWTFVVPEPKRSSASDTTAQAFPQLLHGWIGAGGETVQGFGFDLEKHGAGLYRIRFRNAFSRPPTVVASPATVGQRPVGIPLNMVQIAAVQTQDCWIEVFNFEGLPEDGGLRLWSGSRRGINHSFIRRCLAIPNIDDIMNVGLTEGYFQCFSFLFAVPKFSI